MRHRKAGVKLNRTSSHRKAMFRNMVTSLLKHGKIKTTDVKAKALRAWVDHIITLAKRGDLHARRQALSIVREKTVVHKVFAEAEEKFGGRQGGYTRITKLGYRKGDAAPLSIIELITTGVETAGKKLFDKEEKELVAPVVEKKEPEEVPEAATVDAGADEGVEIAAAKPEETAEAAAESAEPSTAEKPTMDKADTEDSEKPEEKK